MASHAPKSMQEQIKEIAICLFCLFVISPLVAFVMVSMIWMMSIPDRSEPTFSHPTAQAREVAASVAHAGPVDGRALYMAHCASCHGDSGDGKGTRELDRPARSFLAGGFSFGDTEQSITRVVRSGIGGTPMPGFARTLSPRQIQAVVQHVQSMLPERVATNEGDTVMHVGDVPVVVRGKFPEVHLGKGEIPRGLLAGNPDGLSFMYRTDDVRLLGTRQGAFARRSDWDGRGGTALDLQGRLIYLAPDVPVFERDGMPVKARLRGTDVGGEAATVRYEVGDTTIAERAGADTRGPLSGFRRKLDVEDGGGLLYRLPSWQPDGLQQLGAAGAWTWFQEPAFNGRMHFVGVRGAQPLDGGVLKLPAWGTVEIVIYPDAPLDAAREAGLPVEVAS